MDQLLINSLTTNDLQNISDKMKLREITKSSNFMKNSLVYIGLDGKNHYSKEALDQANQLWIYEKYPLIKENENHFKS